MRKRTFKLHCKVEMANTSGISSVAAWAHTSVPYSRVVLHSALGVQVSFVWCVCNDKEIGSDLLTPHEHGRLMQQGHACGYRQRCVRHSAHDLKPYSRDLMPHHLCHLKRHDLSMYCSFECSIAARLGTSQLFQGGARCWRLKSWPRCQLQNRAYRFADSYGYQESCKSLLSAGHQGMTQ